MSIKKKEFYYTRITDWEVLNSSLEPSSILLQRGFPIRPNLDPSGHGTFQDGYCTIMQAMAEDQGRTVQYVCYKEGHHTPDEIREFYQEHFKYWAHLNKLELKHTDLSFDEWLQSELRKRLEEQQEALMRCMENMARPPVMYASTQQQIEHSYRVARKNIQLGIDSVHLKTYMFMAFLAGMAIMWALMVRF